MFSNLPPLTAPQGAYKYYTTNPVSTTKNYLTDDQIYYLLLLKQCFFVYDDEVDLSDPSSFFMHYKALNSGVKKAQEWFAAYICNCPDSLIYFADYTRYFSYFSIVLRIKQMPTFDANPEFHVYFQFKLHYSDNSGDFPRTLSKDLSPNLTIIQAIGESIEWIKSHQTSNNLLFYANLSKLVSLQNDYSSLNQLVAERIASNVRTLNPTPK